MNTPSARKRGHRTSARVQQAVRADLQRGMLQTDIAARHGLSQSTVSRIANYAKPQASAVDIVSFKDAEEIAGMIADLDARVRAALPEGTADDVVEFTTNMLIATHGETV